MKGHETFIPESKLPSLDKKYLGDQFTFESSLWLFPYYNDLNIESTHESWSKKIMFGCSIVSENVSCVDDREIKGNKLTNFIESQTNLIGYSNSRIMGNA
ncbi:hypothetical protein RF11_06112 [Thelohanellus kitauei]|uniref:Uncharacterized protein n=1 Tax=Thelohanellus kitauei TaxID=669202 RepID=A0A0C2M989_THEKT|nr:hypothetical protein RF11_06112 [Thelohanellus kitauei]